MLSEDGPLGTATITNTSRSSFPSHFSIIDSDFIKIDVKNTLYSLWHSMTEYIDWLLINNGSLFLSSGGWEIQEHSAVDSGPGEDRLSGS